MTFPERRRPPAAPRSPCRTPSVPRGGSSADASWLRWRSWSAPSLLVCFDRKGYRDGNDPPTTRSSLIDSIYYTTVTLSTTGYGDIAPVHRSRAPDQRIHHHPAPHRLPGAADRDHPRGPRLAGPRDVPGRPVEEEHGSSTSSSSATAPRDVARSRRSSTTGTTARRSSSSTPARWPEEAHSDGLAVVTGDATRREVLRRAGVQTASRSSSPPTATTPTCSRR